MNNKEKKELIIFDMDGTLINSGNIIANTINYVRINSGLEAMDKDILLANINNPDINSAEFFYEVDAFTPRHSELFEKYYEEHHLKELVLYDGIKELLDDLYPNYILTIATNAHTNFAISMTKHLGINSYFDYIIGADKVKASKPDPAMIQNILDRYNIAKSNIVVIGDSYKDYLAAKAVGIKSILVNWGFSTFDKDLDNLDTQLVDNINQLRDILIK